jgi:hypothetical protein
MDATMTANPAGDCESQRLPLLSSHTLDITFPTVYRTSRTLRHIPSLHPPPTEPLPPLPEPILRSPHHTKSNDSFTSLNTNHHYPPRRGIDVQPSISSLSKYSQHSGPSHSSYYPVLKLSPVIDQNWTVLDGVSSDRVWVGDSVIVATCGRMETRRSLWYGRLDGLYKQREHTALFVFEELRTKKLSVVQVRNGMVKWPAHYKFVHFLRNVCSYLRHKLIGHQLPI